MRNIGVAVVGAGFIGPVHVEALKRLGLPVRGILGVDDRESQGAAHSLALPRAYRDLDELLNDPEVQAVHVARPNRLHYAMTRRALEAGGQRARSRRSRGKSRRPSPRNRFASPEPPLGGVGTGAHLAATSQEENHGGTPVIRRFK